DLPVERRRTRERATHGKGGAALSQQRNALEVRHERRPVDGGRRGLVRPVDAHVVDDADDLAPDSWRARRLNPPPERGLGAAEELASEPRRDQRDGTRLLEIGPLEIAARDEP